MSGQLRQKLSKNQLTYNELLPASQFINFDREAC